jgi:hypothetical protein
MIGVSMQHGCDMANDLPRGIRDVLWVASTIGLSSEVAANRDPAIKAFVAHARAAMARGETTFHRDKEIIGYTASVFHVSERLIRDVAGPLHPST